MTYSASVGGPLAPRLAEAACLFQLRRVRERFPGHADLLAFLNCLVLLDILLKWPGANQTFSRSSETSSTLMCWPPC
jgi:hypothetical protein